MNDFVYLCPVFVHNHIKHITFLRCSYICYTSKRGFFFGIWIKFFFISFYILEGLTILINKDSSASLCQVNTKSGIQLKPLTVTLKF